MSAVWHRSLEFLPFWGWMNAFYNLRLLFHFSPLSNKVNNVGQKPVLKVVFALPNEEVEETNAESLVTNITPTVDYQTPTRNAPAKEKWVKLKTFWQYEVRT
ncbi:hypothetical protein RUND412_003778 [Rhizina undulata]